MQKSNLRKVCQTTILAVWAVKQLPVSIILMYHVEVLCYIGKKKLNQNTSLKDFNLNGALWGYEEAVGLYIALNWNWTCLVIV